MRPENGFRPSARRSAPRTWLLSGLAAACLLLAGAGPAAAQAVPACSALTMYGNAANTGLCKTLSPTTQNLWVCGLTTTDPDVHTTFNLATALHVTVRTPPGVPTCQGNSTLTGAWPNNLAIAAGQPAAVCNVGIQNYVNRLNAVPQMPAQAGQTACTTPFIAAMNAGRISQAVGQTYINTCNAQGCP